ncbi:helix-turn-helix transcriptional regulator [Actinoplanes couchii]|uniref:Transcriptional regulator n=1 Tax=Actinoplanes couchii TaxID=403638 RepID=A0ABQ3X0D3_9ACTN|nr:helix-turn-helix transcriptional regulator [Actinoplanes couchii]MDR6316304.1 transcriptional regulator with XRE-family HTH domain [Actinoplanes couchii]GID51917.1 transcriptional regulator [Actinoplanes couchii]
MNTDEWPLGDVLQAWRARVTPEDAGLATYGDRRRVTGLRREELALLAGMSASYYTRLEQGQSRNASPEVLDAIARALRLNDAERAHLHVLAGTGPARRAIRPPEPEQVDPALAGLLAAIGDVPAIVLGRRTDVLAWNTTGHALLGFGTDRDAHPNMAEMVFTDPHQRDLYVDWPAKARAVVGNLRLTAGRHPDDTMLAALIGRLSMRSAEFATLWADHSVQACSTTDYELHHPLVGRLTTTQQSLRSLSSPEQILVTCTAPAGTPSVEALALLALATGRDRG